MLMLLIKSEVHSLTTAFPPLGTVAPAVPSVGPPEQPCVVPCIETLPGPALNWSYLKLYFYGGPDEDPEAYLLRTNNWMDTHANSR